MDIAHEINVAGESILQLVSFNLGEEEFAVDIFKILEINRMTDITKVPKSPPFVEGVINLRGKVIPVMDLRKRFGMPYGEQSKNTRIVVLDIRKKVVGFIVDSVSEVLRVSSSTIEPPPPMISGIEAEYIRGVAKLEGRLLILLDVNKVLNSGELDSLDGPPVETIQSEIKKENSPSGEGEKEFVMEYRGKAGMVKVEKDIASAINEISNKVEITTEDLQKLVSHVQGILEGKLMDEDLELYGELGELAKYINETKKSLVDFDASQITDQDLPEASDQLQCIVESTEEATNKILTNAEDMLDSQCKISKIVESINSLKINKNTKGEEVRESIINELKEMDSLFGLKLMDIMSACNFQDLTGQRIQKIIALVQGIESKLMKVILSFNIKRKEESGSGDDDTVDKEKEMLAKFEEQDLKGPQKEGEGVNQNDVDDLLNDLFG